MDKFDAKVLNALGKLESEGKIESKPTDEKLEGCSMNEEGILIYPETIVEEFGEFIFEYYIEPKKEYEKMRFLSRDIFGILDVTNPDIDKIIVITDITSDLDPTERPENTNFALREFAEAHSDMLIAIQLYVIAGFEKEATIYHNTSFVEEVIDLEEAGFVDINSYCQFENSIAFVYRNEHSKELLRFITRITLRDYKINNVELEFKDYAEEWFFRLPKKFNYELTPEEKYEINGEEKPMDLEDTQKPSRFRFN